MWHDNETNRDFVNFSAVAKTVSETIRSSGKAPLSIGVCGGWGIGKSSMVNLIRAELGDEGDEYLFVEFNAWLYQGFDDAKASLMEAIARRLLEKAKEREKGIDKAKAFLERVDWIRGAGLLAGGAASVALGLPPIGLIGEIFRAGQGVSDGDVTSDDIEAVESVAKKSGKAGKSLLKPKKAKSPPQEISQLREDFRETLSVLGMKLVVFVDDLDRCLPETTISTLEAMRLFLFIENTAFLIAADDSMIRQAVRAHFNGAELDDDLVTNYFDKLIQIPIRVPPLGTQEVRSFLFLLYVERSEISDDEKEKIRAAVCSRLGQSWSGQRVDQKFMEGVIPNCPERLKEEFQLATRIAPIMTTSDSIRGNPRLIKRFLNTLSIRLSIASDQGVPVDEAALAKMLLFERCGDQALYEKIIRAVNESEDGCPLFLKDFEEAARKGTNIDDEKWNNEFERQWLTLSPQFNDLDLRGVVFASKDFLPMISTGDHLSPEANELLEVLLAIDNKTVRSSLASSLAELPRRELNQILDRVISRARREQKWGNPPALYQLLTLAKADPSFVQPISDFFKSLNPKHIDGVIVAALRSLPSSNEVFSAWMSKKGVPDAVKKAIETFSK